jgi:hypothetical protein
VGALQAESLVIVTVAAATGLALVDLVVLPIATHSPTFKADLVVVEASVNLVDVPNATSLVPFEVVTLTPALPTEVTFPATARVENARLRPAPPADEPAGSFVPPPEAELPQAARTVAPAASTRMRVARCRDE